MIYHAAIKPASERQNGPFLLRLLLAGECYDYHQISEIVRDKAVNSVVMMSAQLSGF